MTLLEKVKANLILEHTADDELLQMYITAATRYAESYQHLAESYYSSNTMPPTTEQTLFASYLTVSRTMHETTELSHFPRLMFGMILIPPQMSNRFLVNLV